MGKSNQPNVAREDSGEDARGHGAEQVVPRWTLWEILGLLMSAVLVAAPLLSLGYTFLFPSLAPAQVMAPTPTSDLLTSTPGPSPTPTDTLPPTDTPTPGPTETWTPTPSGSFSVGKAANKDLALLGEEVLFSIGLSNGGGTEVSVTVNDTLPAQLSLASVWHTCPSGTVTPVGNSFSGTLQVPAGQSCQIFVSAFVVDACNCYVVNTVSWNTGSDSGNASSQPVFLSDAPTPTPTTVPTVPTQPGGPTATPVSATDTPTPGPSFTPSNTPTPGPSFTPSNTPTPGPSFTPTHTPTPGPSFTPTPPPATNTATPSPAFTLTPSTGPIPSPTFTPTRGPSPTPQPPPPTEPPEDRPTPVPPTAIPPCAQARVIGEVCVAYTTVTISSCCPEWSAQTTTDASGHFEFSALTPGTFTIRALGRSRTITLPACDSVVTVNLCPSGPVPTATPPTTVEPTTTGTPSPHAGATQPPTTGDVTLHLETDHTLVQAGESLVFFFTLRNDQTTALQGILVQSVFTDVLMLQGAVAAVGAPNVFGQSVTLEAAQLGGSSELSLQVDAFVRPDTAIGTVFTVRGTAQASGEDTIYSNVLELEVVGGGVARTAVPGSTPVATAAGGPGETQPTAVPPLGPSGTGGELPYTGTGLPMVGVMLGSVVLLARQLRLRRVGRQQGS